MTGGGGGRSGRTIGRIGLLLLLFLLGVLLLAGRREFFDSDGRMEYRVGEALYHRAAIDLPPELAAEKDRYVLGADGRAYSVFGIGAAVQFAAAVAADRALGRVTGEAPPPREGEGRPGFFATGANLPVTALTGLAIFLLAADLGVALPAAAIAALLAVCGTMAAVYATLSFDMPLANLLLLAGTLFFFRACRGARVRDALLAGVLLGAGLLTRITTAIFLPLLALHALGAARAGVARRLLRPAAACAAALAAALVVLAWYNLRRFGGVFATGYSEQLVAYNFDAPLLTSVPGLLLSPGRSVLVFSPILLAALAGIPALLRARRAEGATLLLMTLANFLFFAANRNWANVYVTWGPRFQLPTTLLLAVPLGFAVERALRAGGARRIALGALGAVSVALQVAVLAAGFSPPKRDVWLFWYSQPVRAVRDFAALVGGGGREDPMVWWTGPWSAQAPLRALAWIAAVTAVVAGVLLARELRRLARSGSPSPAPPPGD